MSVTFRLLHALVSGFPPSSSFVFVQNSGSNSPMSTNSPLCILVASFAGTGGRPSLTYTPFEGVVRRTLAPEEGSQSLLPSTPPAGWSCCLPPRWVGLRW